MSGSPSGDARSALSDLLNLHDLPWSARGTPYPTGTLVFDDATGEPLAVYPNDPPDP